MDEKTPMPDAAKRSNGDLAHRTREERFAVIDRMRDAIRDVPAEEIEREAERSVAAARERLRRGQTRLTAK